MAYNTLITSSEAFRYLHDPHWRFIDCRYYLEQPQQGHSEYLTSHLPGALYADLATDLSSPVIPGISGRHPLPEVSAFCRILSDWGVGDETQVVVYDQGPGMIAARLWWMLHWLGHSKAAVLEGGWNKWLAEAKPVSLESPAVKPQRFSANIHPEFVADANDILADIASPDIKILDARAADRYRGENETLDPVAGHIPGALSAPFMNNVAADGCFLATQALREMYQGLLGDTEAGNTIVYCGSGVTAAHTILAIKHIGFGMARLYPGSWSHWITDKRRPIEPAHE